MPKRTGLGQRGLDLLISASPGGKEADSVKEDAAEEKKTSRSKKTAGTKKTSKASTGKSGKAAEDRETAKSAGGKKSAGSTKGFCTGRPDIQGVSGCFSWKNTQKNTPRPGACFCDIIRYRQGIVQLKLIIVKVRGFQPSLSQKTLIVKASRCY